MGTLVGITLEGEDTGTLVGGRIGFIETGARVATSVGGPDSGLIPSIYIRTSANKR